MRRPLVFLSILLASCGGDGSPAPGETRIAAVQGAGTVSPLAGEVVTVQGIVTGDFQSGDADRLNDLGGFFLGDPSPDGDPGTSDGIFVFDGRSPDTDVGVGDRVRVAGTVTEFFGETQIAATSVEVTGRGSLSPVDLRLPAAALVGNGNGVPIADLERYEGMLVRFAGTLTVASFEELEAYGAILLSSGGRPFQYTNRNRPDAAGYARHLAELAARRIVLDDGRREAGPEHLRWLGTGFPLRIGDSVEGLTGNLRYARGSGEAGFETWRLMPAGEPRFSSGNPRRAPPVTGGTLRVAGFNVLNFFPTVDTGAAACGPGGRSGCRGADSEAELVRQVDKLVAQLTALDADIAGLTELENDERESLETLVDALNAADDDVWAWVDTGVIGTDAIKVGFVYKPASVSPSGDFAILDRSVDPRFDDDRNRPVLAQTFRRTEDGAALTVAVAHLKSKGSPCGEDPDVADGQGNCSGVRRAAAAAMAEWLAADPTGSGDPDVLIVGDLNAYAMEEPLLALEAAGFVDLFDDPESYSYVFAGASGQFDHALASPSLAAQVDGAALWHANADEPAVRDYNLDRGRDPSIYEAAPYRASDHDPVIVGLTLDN